MLINLIELHLNLTWLEKIIKYVMCFKVKETNKHAVKLDKLAFEFLLWL